MTNIPKTGLTTRDILTISVIIGGFVVQTFRFETRTDDFIIQVTASIAKIENRLASLTEGQNSHAVEIAKTGTHIENIKDKLKD